MDGSCLIQGFELKESCSVYSDHGLHFKGEIEKLLRKFNIQHHKFSPYCPQTPFKSELFKNDRCREVFEKLNCKRKIWAERFVVSDDVDLAIWANFESKGWLSLLEVDHPPPTALIREFFSNLSCHIYDSNTLVRSWIRRVEFTITPRVVADALGVSVVRELVYPYEESPPLDDVMSYITGSSI